MHLQFDTLGGIAGDMFIAAMLDAWPEHSAGLVAAIRAAGVPEACEVSIESHRDHVLGGRRFRVREHGGARHHGAEHSHAGHETHASYRDIAVRLRRAGLEPRVVERALAIFDLLARAEAQVHGVAVEDVTFHEIGAWDSIADVVGAAYLIDTLRLTSWSVGALPLGGGRVATAHGAMPVPAPATALLLKGFTLVDDGIQGERVTPTGAAILAYLRSTLGPPGQSPMRPMKLERSGMGFGTRTLPGLSNVLRILAFDDAAVFGKDDWIGVIQFEVDDQSPEDLAAGIDALRGLAGVLDVLQVAATGKKGRMITQLQVLCRREALSSTIEACFLETATIGLRWTLTARTALDRSVHTVEIGGQPVAVKVARRPGDARTAKAEIDDVRGPGGRAAREQRRSSAEASALQAPPTDDAWKRR